MLYFIIVFLSIVGIVLCRFISETRKALAVALFISVYAINDIMQVRWEIYERSPLFPKIMLALLFIIFLLIFTICCRNTSALLKFELAVSVCMLFFCILSICVWENILNVSSDMLLTCIFVFMAPLYPFRSILPVSLGGMDIPLLIALIPLALVIGTSFLLKTTSSGKDSVHL